MTDTDKLASEDKAIMFELIYEGIDWKGKTLLAIPLWKYLEKCVQKLILLARIDTLKELIINIDELPFTVHPKTRLIYELENDRINLRIEQFQQELKSLEDKE